MELFLIFSVYISEHPERRREMKRLISVLVLFALCLSMISCDELLAGIGNESGEVERTKDSVIESMPPETWYASDTEIGICVDWSDFVRIEGRIYDGGFSNETVDESRIGKRIGEILHNVKSLYSSQEEMREDENRNFSASFRGIGCEIFEVKDDGNSIAVLDDGKYYLYSIRDDASISFEVFGGEMYGLPGSDDKNRAFAVNTPLQLGELYGCETPMPQEISERYSGDRLNNITLIIVELVSGWGGTDYGITSVNKSGDDLLVSAVELDSDGLGDCAMHYWTFFIEIPKTDDKEVKISLNTVKPLEIDSELTSISSSQMSNYIYYDPEVDYGRYEGKAVCTKAVAEELVRGTGNYGGYSAFVRFCPTNNYWLVSLSRFGESSSHIVDTVVRAADGKIISQIEAFGCG